MTRANRLNGFAFLPADCALPIRRLFGRTADPYSAGTEGHAHAAIPD
ncbi:hypothetical protein ACX8XN_08400 [Calditrichota bacterium GD2]